MTFEIAHKHSQHRLSNGVTGSYQTVSKNDGTVTTEGKYILTLEGLEDNGIFSHYKVDNSTSLPTHQIWGIAVYASRELVLLGTLHAKCELTRGMKCLDAVLITPMMDSGMIGV